MITPTIKYANVRVAVAPTANYRKINPKLIILSKTSTIIPREFGPQPIGQPLSPWQAEPVILQQIGIMQKGGEPSGSCVARVD
jgi:hypothetical protein